MTTTWEEFVQEYKNNFGVINDQQRNIMKQIHADIKDPKQKNNPNAIYNSWINVLDRTGKTLDLVLLHEIQLQHSPRRDAPSPAPANVESKENAYDATLKSAPWADFDLSAFSNIQDVQQARDKLAEATEFDPKSLEKLVQADLTLRLYQAFKMKMSMKPGSGGGKRLENEPEYKYTAPKPRPM